jgi:hypothetical protein
MLTNESSFTHMKIQQNPLNRENLEDSVFSLELTRKQLLEEKSHVDKTNECLEVCIKFLGGILKTHSRADIPNHDSDESLYFFKNQQGEPVLIKELEPSPDLMPEMKRIPLSEALTQKMKGREIGYVIQRVRFSYPMGKHQLMLICFEKSLFQKL